MSITGVGGVFDDVGSLSMESMESMDEVGVRDGLGCARNFLQFLAILGRAVGIPGQHILVDTGPKTIDNIPNPIAQVVDAVVGSLTELVHSFAD
eukprot:g34914.t1